jgi:hypothetical protein
MRKSVEVMNGRVFLIRWSVGVCELLCNDEDGGEL